MAVTNPTRGNGSTEKKMTPEIYFARKLASNDKKIRDKTLKKLRKWITARSAVPDAFNEEELMKLWKGLFYCMWMSDKPLVQEDLAEMISSLVHCVADRKTGLRFVDAALKIMARDWPGIDVWRMDKFLMFVRRIIRHSLEYLANEGWKDEEVKIFAEILSNTVINANQSTTKLKIPIGLQLHIINLLPEELAKAGGSDLSSATVLKMLEPFVKCLAVSNDFRLRKDIIEHVFIYLIKQSDEGIAYEEGGDEAPSKGSNKRSKKEQPEPENDETEENNENVEESEDDAGESDNEDMNDKEGNPDWGAKDPRAGGVDVLLPQLRLSYTDLASMFFQMASEKTVRSKNRKAMYRLVQWFKDLANGVYPLAVQMPEVGPGLTPRMMKKATQAYIKEELSLSEQRALERELAKKENKKMNQASKKYLKADEGSDMSDDDAQSDEMDDSDLDSENEDDYSDIEDEADTEDNDEDEEPEAISKPIPKVASKAKLAPAKKSKPIAQTFEVEDNWEDETNPKPQQASAEAKQAEMQFQQLKKKLKASKRPLAAGWTESPMKKPAEKEVEIIIPNKRAKTKAQVQESPTQATEETPNGKNRRVKIVLNRNTEQDPKDYQESIRKSPGLPHDPDKQPSRGGVLKRSAAPTQKLAFDQTKRAPRTRKV